MTFDFVSSARLSTAVAALILAASASAAEVPDTTAEEEVPASAASALNAATATVEQIQACSRGNLAAKGSLRDVTLKSKGRDGKERVLKLKLFWKPAKGSGAGRLNARVVEPKEIAGSSYLLIEGENGAKEQLYFYLPAADKVQQVGGDDLTRPLWGTDLSYNDLKQLQGLAVAGTTERVKDEVVDGRAAYRLDTKLAESTPQYSSLHSYVDQATCIPLKTDFLDKKGKIVKQLDADTKTLSELAPYWFVTAYSLKDLKRGSQTDIGLSDIYLLENLAEKNFAPDAFYLSNE